MLRASLLLALSALFLPSVAGCDAGPYEDEQTVGPPINFVPSRSNIGAGHTYTVDQPIVLAFDRFLNPETVTRQSIYLEDSSGNEITEELIAYDPVTLTVSLANPQTGGLPWLTPGEGYRVVVNVPSSDGGTPYGLMAIDGATLAAPATILFTAEAAPANPTPGPPTIDFCTDIQRRIFTCSCAYAGCHESATPRPATLDAGTGYPREGLDLSSPAGLLATAIGQVADESNTGPLAAVGSPSITQPFGINMAVIAASEPGNSWLVYKTLLAIPDPPDAEVLPLEGGAGAYAQSLVTPVSASERAILSNFITGQAMPYPYPSTAEPSQGAITEGDIERLSLWIAEGAQVPATCPAVDYTCP